MDCFFLLVVLFSAGFSLSAWPGVSVCFSVCHSFLTSKNVMPFDISYIIHFHTLFIRQFTICRSCIGFLYTPI